MASLVQSTRLRPALSDAARAASIASSRRRIFAHGAAARTSAERLAAARRTAVMWRLVMVRLVVFRRLLALGDEVG